MSPPNARRDLLGVPPGRLDAELGDLVDRPFRARQIFQALHHRRVRDFAAMTELPLALRRRLELDFAIDLPEIVERRPAEDGTTKYLLRLRDGASIETVDIPDRDRRTLCISSQAGCALACAFCVTGYWGAGRDLTAGEIVAQVRLLEQIAELPETYNLVFMGMGEPLLNLEALRDALEVLSTTLSMRRITVSTAGVVPGIEKIATWTSRPQLAVSLHAPDDERRDRIMPINRSWPLDELISALRRFPLESRRRITIEYILIDGFNDDPRDADALVRRLAHVPVKFNLIPLNPDPVLADWMRPPEAARVDAFQRRLESRGATATVRRQRGHEVAAACGQLRAFGRDPRGLRARGRTAARGRPRS